MTSLTASACSACCCCRRCRSAARRSSSTRACTLRTRRRSAHTASVPAHAPAMCTATPTLTPWKSVRPAIGTHLAAKVVSRKGSSTATSSGLAVTRGISRPSTTRPITPPGLAMCTEPAAAAFVSAPFDTAASVAALAPTVAPMNAAHSPSAPCVCSTSRPITYVTNTVSYRRAQLSNTNALVASCHHAGLRTFRPSVAAGSMCRLLVTRKASSCAATRV
mmetsp:Transcript_27467/g.81418  ORF Transcript_27467/g.81418 Transcript_27467/m.81418 type:complete len:220 (-) Transcript_27467:22-681(-)